MKIKAWAESGKTRSKIVPGNASDADGPAPVGRVRDLRDDGERELGPILKISFGRNLRIKFKKGQM
jgi:hypothetical protein